MARGGIVADISTFIAPTIQVVGTGVFALAALFVKRWLDGRAGDDPDGTSSAVKELAMDNARKELEIEHLREEIAERKEAGEQT